MFKSISIRTQLYVAFSLLLALLIAMALLALFQLKELKDVGGRFTGEWLPEVEILNELKRVIDENLLLAELRIQRQRLQQTAISQRQKKVAAAIEAAVQSYIATDKLGHGTELIHDFASQWGRYEDALGRANDLFNRGETDRGNLVLQQEAVPNLDVGAGLVEKLLDDVRAHGNEATTDLESAHRRFLWLTVAMIVLAALCAGVLVVWISRSISAPIRRVSNAMNLLSRGGDSGEIPDGAGRQDEIGTLLRAANRYRDSLVLSRQLTERLDTALSNMPVGLAMFDENKKLIICNQRYARIYQLPQALTRAGTPFLSILEDRVSQGLFPAEKVSWFTGDILSRIRQDEAHTCPLKLLDGRTINIVRQRMSSGGWVSVHEDVTDKHKMEERVAYMARHDMLTDLPNRFHFREQTEEALARMDREDSLAVLCLDLDRFKAINDTLGHPIGDALLCMVARRLQDEVREEDIVGRLGGDEFAIVQIGADQPVSATTLSERIIKTLSEPYEIDGHQVIAGTCIGISIAPLDGTHPDQLLKNADMALYKAKQEARGSYRFFEMEMDARMQARRRMELDLRHAMATNEFELHYQPQLKLKTNGITGFEALIRWNHSDREILPAEFIPLAEEIGLIIPIGQWVISQACMDAAQWSDSYKIAVNLSPVQFKDPRLVQTVRNALSASGLRPNRLELEITETVLLTDTETVLSILHRFHELGVRVSLDDFGTGYSSLSYLRSFPFDKIKIDRSFINDLGIDSNANAIIRAITGLGASLGIDTTAEGIETLDQLMRVQQEGCTEVQGFLIGRPQPASAIAGLIHEAEASEERLMARSRPFKQ